MLQNLKVYKNKLFSEITVIPTILKPARLPGLDGLRGISIIIVIANHLVLNTIYQDYFIGFMGVQAFFVISGFLITTLLLKEKVNTGSISLKHFYIRRFLRILPVAYLFLLCVFILNLLLKLNIRFISIASCLIFVQNFPIHKFYNPYLRHFWSLSVEEQFYFTFPFLLAYSVEKYAKIITALIVFVVVISLLGYNNVGIFNSNKCVHVISFIIINLFGSTVAILIGSLLSILLFKDVIKIRDTFFTRYISLVVLIIAILTRITYSWINIPYSEVFLYPLLIGIVIIFNLNPNSILTKMLSNKILIYIGTISYSLYIWQSLFTDPEIWLINTRSILLHLIVLFAVANASYYLYERYFMKLKRKF